MSSLELLLLGNPQVQQDGQAADIRRRKSLALLAYLAVTGEPQRRDTLATLLWPDSSQSNARGTLRRELSALNTALDGDWLVTERDTVQLRAGFQLDTAEFEQCLADCEADSSACIEALAAAVDLYRDDFLTGFTLSNCPDFDEWQFFHTERFRRQFSTTLEQLIDLYRGQGDFEAALPYAQRWLAFDPLHEPAHQQMMRLYAQTGQLAAALRQYQFCVQILNDELGVPPSEETVALYNQLRTRTPPAAGSKPPAAPTAEHPPEQPADAGRIYVNLPTLSTPFVGRTEEVAQITERLNDPDCRLLALVGPGGIGKTRLAIEAAASLAPTRTEADPPFQIISFVSLFGVSAPSGLVSTIAETLSFSFYGDGSPKQQLLDYLREKRALLVLDNFEHLLAGVELISDLLAAAPDLKILVTSREALNLQEEWLQPVTGMAYPERETLEIEALKQYSAVQLFLQRAQQVAPDFTFEAEKRCVIRICRLVEGMPLAIELAATWLKVFTCDQIVEEIEHGLDILSSSLRNIPARHRSIRAVFESSWELLTAAEQDVMRKLSVFRSDFHREAAEIVAETRLPTLIALVEKSLLRTVSSGSYQLHELLRQFALEKLQANFDDYLSTRNRHSDYYLAFLGEQARQVDDGQLPEVLGEIDAEIENILAAWYWAIEHRGFVRLDWAVFGLHDFLHTRSRFYEGRAAFRAAAKYLQSRPDPDDEQALILAKLLVREASFNVSLGNEYPTDDLLTRSLAITRRLGADDETVFILNLQATLAFRHGDINGAESLFEESLELSRRLKNKVSMAYSLMGLGEIANELGNNWRAERCWQESLTLNKAAGRPNDIAYSLDKMGAVSFMQGRYAESEQFYREALAIFKAIGDRYGLALTLGGRAQAYVAAGEASKYAQARAMAEESLQHIRDIGYRTDLPIRLAILGWINSTMGDYESAEGYMREALALTRESGIPHSTAWALAGLGEALAGQRDFQQARPYLLEALEIAQAGHFIPAGVNALFQYARLLIKEAHRLKRDTALRRQKIDTAIRLLFFIWYQPGGWQYNKDKAISLIDRLKAEIPPEAADSAAERARRQAFEAVVADILAEADSPSQTD